MAFRKKNLISLLPAGIALVALALFAIAQQVQAGPITGGPGNAPFTKLGVYQGVIAVVPGGGTDSVMEIGNAGRDIATTGDLVLRPGSAKNTYLNSGSLCFGAIGSADCRSTWVGVGGGNLTLDQVLGFGNKSDLNVGLGRDDISPLSNLVINKGLAAANNGDANNAISIIATSGGTGSAIYSQQNNVAGWAGYFDGKTNFTSDVRVTGKIILNGIGKQTWVIKVCAINNGACLGQYLSTTGTTQTGAGAMRYYYHASNNTIQWVLVYSSTPIEGCADGQQMRPRSLGGISRYEGRGCVVGSDEFTLGGAAAYGSGNWCEGPADVYFTASNLTSSACTNVDLNKQGYKVLPTIVTNLPVYELR